MAVNDEANALLVSLLEGKTFTYPTINFNDPLLLIPGDINSELYKSIKGVTIEDLTSRQVGGSGVFDAMMQSLGNHIKEEYEKGRITGGEYTKAYIELTQAAMQAAVQFALNKDQAFWQSQQAQIAAISARVQLESLKMNLVKAQYEAMLIEIQYATGKINLATTKAQYDKARFEVDFMMPTQRTLLQTQNDTANYQLTQILPSQAILAREQGNAAQAQTSDFRGDGAVVSGVLGRQKELYGQQIKSYVLDGKVKTGKLFSDAWITMKTMDEGLAPPSVFTNPGIEMVMVNLRSSAEIT